MRAHLGIDVGKTNLRVGVFNRDLTVIERWSVPTADVEAAKTALETKLATLRASFEVQTTGISIFGPLQVDPAKDDYGALVESSEAVWSGINIPETVAIAIGPNVHFDFDVNAGAVAEAELGAGRNRKSFVYLSVGTGIGATYFRKVHRPGFAPQIGHTFIPREPDDLSFEGSCRFHGGCLQGLASGKALLQRWGIPAEGLEMDHPGWDLEARYLARACANLIYTFSPEAIVLGSSVGSAAKLVETINGYIPALLNDFIDPDLRTLYREHPAVVRAAFGTGSSTIGAALLGINRSGLKFS